SSAVLMTAVWSSTCAASRMKRASSPTSTVSNSEASMGWRDRLASRGPRDGDGHIAAQMQAAFEASRRADYAEALKLSEPLAQAGVPGAQNNVGACLAGGVGADRDPSLAARWLSLAAEAGDAVGRRNLAALYFKGEGVAQDYVRAAELYRAASEQGDG